MQHENGRFPQRLSQIGRSLVARFGRFLDRSGPAAAEGLASVIAARLSPAPAALPAPANTPARRLSLALQGGGAHGAFTWGVLDRLLAARTYEIDGISGTSAGALNAVALAAGYLDGGPEGAREKLAALWESIEALAPFSPARVTPIERLVTGWNADWSIAHILLDHFSRFVSPYQLNPLGLNPLRDILSRLIDFERLAQPDAIRLFIAATNVETGGRRVFSNAELSADAVLASAALPTLHQAVKLPDGYYWDGGFTANPALLPLVERCEASEILLIRINPTRESGVPLTARGIQSRLKRIVLDAPLKREIELIDCLRRAMEQSGAAASPLGQRLTALRIHTVSEDALMRKLGMASELTPEPRLIRLLHEAGVQAGERWIAGESDESSVDGDALRSERPASFP